MKCNIRLTENFSANLCGEKLPKNAAYGKVTNDRGKTIFWFYYIDWKHVNNKGEIMIMFPDDKFFRPHNNGRFLIKFKCLLNALEELFANNRWLAREILSYPLSAKHQPRPTMKESRWEFSDVHRPAPDKGEDVKQDEGNRANYSHPIGRDEHKSAHERYKEALGPTTYDEWKVDRAIVLAHAMRKTEQPSG